MKKRSLLSLLLKEAVNMYFVYILQCSDGSLYTGSTNDVDKRVGIHNMGKTGAKYTKARRPVFLVYQEQCETKSDALKREHAIKKLARKEKLTLFSE